MTNKNKLIVGGVLVVLVGYYLYDRNKKMKEVARLKALADADAEARTKKTKPTNTSRANS